MTNAISPVKGVAARICFFIFIFLPRNIFFLEKTEAKIADSLTEANVRFALNAIRQFASDFQSISAHRISPTRHMLLSGGTYENIGDNGQNTYQMLVSDSKQGVWLSQQLHATIATRLFI